MGVFGGLVQSFLSAGDNRLGSSTAFTITTQSLQTVRDTTTLGTGYVHASNQALVHDWRAEAAIDLGAIATSSSGAISLPADAYVWRNSRYPSANKLMRIQSLDTQRKRVVSRYSCAFACGSKDGWREIADASIQNIKLAPAP